MLVLASIILSGCDGKNSSGAGNIFDEQDRFLQSATGRWDNGAFIYSSGRIVGDLDTHTMVITPVGLYDEVNKLQTVKVTMYDKLSVTQTAEKLRNKVCPPTFTPEPVCGVFSRMSMSDDRHDVQLVSTQDVTNITTKINETSEIIKKEAVQTFDDVIIYNASRVPDTFLLGMKSGRGKNIFVAGFVRKLNETEQTRLIKIAVGAEVYLPAENSADIDKLAAEVLQGYKDKLAVSDVIRAQMDKRDALLAKIKKDITPMVQAAEIFFVKHRRPAESLQELGFDPQPTAEILEYSYPSLERLGPGNSWGLQLTIRKGPAVILNLEDRETRGVLISVWGQEKVYSSMFEYITVHPYDPTQEATYGAKTPVKYWKF